MQTPPLLAKYPPSDWFGRNWKWFVPALVLALTACALGFIYAVTSVLKASDAYRLAVQLARSDPAVLAAIGHPIKERLLVSGTVNVSGPSGTASLAIPISGPKGKATIYVEATKSLGQWRFDDLVVQVGSTRDRIDVPVPSKMKRPREAAPPG